MNPVNHNGDGAVTYTPDDKECDKICKSEENRSHAVCISYTIEDEDDKLQVRVPPIANDDTDTTDQDTPVLENDEHPDPADDVFIEEVTEQPEYGTATPENGGIIYDPT